MKIKKMISILLAAVCILTSTIPSATFANAGSNEDNSECLSLINNFISTINNKDVDGYISLFAESIKSEMEDYLTYAEDDSNFFREDTIELINISKLSTSVGKISAGLSTDELLAYDEIMFTMQN